MVNKVILVGNLGRDPEVRTLENGTKVARVSIATNETYRDRNTNEFVTNTEWHDLVLWRFLAEKIERYTKGTMVYVEGKLIHRKWTDKEGIDRYSTEVVVNQLRRLSSREQSSNAENTPFQSNPTTSVDPPSPPSSSGDTADNAPSIEDDLPF